MSLRPAAIIEHRGGLYVVIDDPDTVGVLLIPCSFEHRQIPAAIPPDCTVHRARPTEDLVDALRPIAELRDGHLAADWLDMPAAKVAALVRAAREAVAG